MVGHMKSKHLGQKVSVKKINPSKKSKPSDVKTSNEGDENNSEDDEENDLDYDPNAKYSEEEGNSEDEDSGGEEKNIDYSKVEATDGSERFVRTRSSRANGQDENKQINQIVKDNGSTTVDIDSLFSELRGADIRKQNEEWRKVAREGSNAAETIDKPKEEDKYAQEDSNGKIKIQVSYTFAGKVMTESKLVDSGSAEAKAYKNSTQNINVDSSNRKPLRSYINVTRIPSGEKEPRELMIKFKRPSLIDKYLSTYGKNQKLSTLEMSRLQWASFVDSGDMKDELEANNKGGYLDRQDFLNRVQHRNDLAYQKSKELERERQWRLQQNGP